MRKKRKCVRKKRLMSKDKMERIMYEKKTRFEQGYLQTLQYHPTPYG